MPTLTATMLRSVNTASSWLSTWSRGMGKIAETPWVFCEVIAVITEQAKLPVADIALISA